MKHKSPARKWRRRSFRETVSQVQRDTGVRRETAVTMLIHAGADWRTFGLAYTGFGETPLGPPLPERLVKAQSWQTDGIPHGARINPETGVKERTGAH